MSNRNFDASQIPKRVRDLNVAQQLYGAFINGKPPGNPQTTNSQTSIVTNEYYPGVQTTAEQSLQSTYSFNLGGIANYLVSPDSATVPGPPTIDIIEPGNGQATVYFTAGSDGGSPITNYEFSVDNGVTFVALSPTTIISPFVIYMLINGTTYDVVIRAVNSVGPGASSNMLQVTPATAPSAPNNLCVIPGDTQITLYFTPPSNNGGSVVTDYQYNIGSGWYSIGTSSPYTITGLTNGVSTTIQLRALNDAGAGTEASVSCVPIPSNSFNPGLISNMNIWLDGQVPAKVITSESQVTAWNDSSTAGNNFAKGPTGTITYDFPSGINNRPALNFTTSAPSTSTYLSKSFNISSTNQITTFLVVRQTGTGASGNSELFFTRTNFRYFDIFNNTNSTGILSINIGDGTQRSSGVDIITTPPTNAIISFVADSTADMFVNGSSTSISGTARGGLSLNDTLEWAVSAGAFLGNIGEVITYSVPLTTLQRQQVEGYLAWKWGTQDSLPVDHPYYNSPPTGPPSGNIYTAPSNNVGVDIVQQSPFSGGGNSYDFGSGDYLSLVGDNSWAFGTSDFTIEWFQYETDSSPFPRIFQIGSYPAISIGCSIEGGSFYAWFPGANFFGSAVPYKNTWVHFAIVRRSGNMYVYKNGVQLGSSQSNTTNIINNSTTLYIGVENGGTSGTQFTGYLTNMRIVKGLAVYTGNFTVPTSSLTLTAPANPYGGSNTVAIPADFTKLLLVPASVPSAPTNLVGTSASGQVSIDFTDGSDGGSAITGYKYSVNGGLYQSATLSKPITITGLTNGTTYSFKIKAVNSVGDGAESASILITPLPGSGLVLFLDAANYTSGSVWPESSGKSKNATIFNSPIKSDSNGGRVEFNGINQYASIPAETVDFSNGITVLSFANFGNANSWERIIDFGNGSANNNILLTRQSTANNLIFEFYNNTSQVFTYSVVDGVANSAWGFYGGKANGTTYRVFAQNANNVGSNSSLPLTVERTNNYIGRSNWSGDSYFEGYMGVIAVFNTALSDADITAFFDTFKSRYLPSPPIGLSATAGNGTADISFTAGSDNGSAITNYKYSTNNVDYYAFSPADATSPVTVTGLTNGTPYSISLKAVNAVGDSVASETVGVTPDGILTITEFKTVGSTTWTAPARTTSVEYLVVGGGGGGASGSAPERSGGGGGGGMVKTGTVSVIPGSSYNITVGDGGAAGTSTTVGLSGINSLFNTVVALGGGGGDSGQQSTTGLGGIAANNTTNSASTGGKGGRYTINTAGGGGGASSGNGGNSTGSGPLSIGGIGGTGTSSSISGSELIYGIGGAGGTANSASPPPTNPNTGNGGGGWASGGDGVAGGSGIVILKYYA